MSDDLAFSAKDTPMVSPVGFFRCIRAKGVWGWDWVTEVREVGTPVRKATDASAGRAGWLWRRSLP